MIFDAILSVRSVLTTLPLGGDSPRALVEHTADVILALNKKYFDSLCRWLNTVLAQENFPSTLVNHQQKENFCRFILK